MLPDDTKGKGCVPQPRTESHKVRPRSLLIYLRSNVLQESRESIPKCHQDGQKVLSGVVQKACSGFWWNRVQGATYGMGEVPAMSFSEPWDSGFKSPELMTAACIVSVFRGFFSTFINVHVLACLSMCVEIGGLKHD